MSFVHTEAAANLQSHLKILFFYPDTVGFTCKIMSQFIFIQHYQTCPLQVKKMYLTNTEIANDYYK